MASIFFRRLNEKYGKSGKANIKGKRYQKMIKEILAHNNEKMSNAIGRLTNQNYKDSMAKLSKMKAKIVKLPDLTDVLPKRSVFVIKGAESGKVVSNTLRTRLEHDLRTTLKKYMSTGQPRMEIQRGISTGKINPKLIKEFQTAIKGTFENYTKKDPKIGIPKNIKAIAITETRSAIDFMKSEYKNQLVRKNKGNIRITKTWKHNRQLSKVPRIGHMKLHNLTLLDEEKFYVEREDRGGFDLMDRPHDPIAPAYQNIHCSCDIIYKAQIIEKESL